MQLYINNQLADLAEDSPIALTFQINNLAEVKNQQGNTSNQFKLPLTQRNRRILGFPDDVAFNTGELYKRYEAKIIQDGLEIIPYGTAEINSVDNDTVNITILSGNVDFFDAIDGKLYDLGDTGIPPVRQNPFTGYEHSWTLDNVIQSQSKTEGWIWPVVDYGRLQYDPEIAQPQIDVRDMRPGFFLKTAIELMAKNVGFIIDPKSILLNDPLYNKLIVQFANDEFEHGSDFQTSTDNYSVTASKPETQLLNTTNGYISFTETSDRSDSFNYDRYIAKEAVSLNVKLDFSVTIQDITPVFFNTIPYMKISLFKGTPGTNQLLEEVTYSWESIKRFNTKKFDQQGFNLDVNLLQGESLFFTSLLYPDNTRIRGWFNAGSKLSITNKKTNVIYNQPVQCERIFPDISQKDLLKDALQRFGIICQTDSVNRTITLASFRDIVNNIPKAKNWTAKCLDQGKTISFQLGGYAQVNYLKHKQDDAIPPGFGDAQITIADKNLPASATLFESQFAPTLSRPYITGEIALINKVEADDEEKEYSINTQPRLLIDQKFNLNDRGLKVKFTEGNPATDRVYNDEISIPYFYKDNAEMLSGDYGPASLQFDDLRKKYYPELEKILQQTKKVMRYFMLTPRDILDLDLLIPVYLEQDGAYYYINKIDSWRKGQACKVELVRL